MYMWQMTVDDAERENRKLITTQEFILRGKRMDVERSTSHLPALLRTAGVPLELAGLKLTMFADFLPHEKGQASLSAMRETIATRFDEMGRFDVGGGFLDDTGRPHHEHACGLALLGVPSTGKTSFASAVLRYAAWRSNSVKFVTIEAFADFHTGAIDLSKFADKYDDYAERADEWRAEEWRMWKVYDFLVIDDVLRSKIPDFVYDELHATMRSRAAEGKFTIITANRPLSTFGELQPSMAAFIDRAYYIVPFVEGQEIAGSRAR